MRTGALFSLLFFCAAAAFGQQGNIWYFGGNAGLDFNTSPPSVLTNGSLSTLEGCASMSDPSGQILFYTDGIKVWNKTHGVMVNGTGLKGDPSASQSGIIVPWPGNDSLYFIFTASATTSLSVGYNYSVVNMNMNGGLGEVTVKNIRLYPEMCTEKITIAKHANGVDWWVITKEFGNNRFKVFQVSSAGVSMTPVVSDVGPSHNGSAYIAAGCMRASPDGSKLALAINSFSSSSVELNEANLFDFDNVTGIISNPISIPGQRSYGVEFSPDSKLLYVSFEPYNTGGNGRVDQFNLTLTGPAAILASRTNVTPTGYPGRSCGMQLAPDGKLYVVRNDQFAIDVIHNPNTVGAACNYQVGYVNLGRRTGMMPPNIIPTFLVPVQLSIKADTLSFCDRTIKFSTLSNYNSVVSYRWDFGDGTSSSLNTPVKTFPWNNDTFNVAISIDVDVSRAGGGSALQTKTALIKIIFDAKPTANFGTQVTCGNKQIDFSDSSTIKAGTISSYYWSLGDASVSALKSPQYNYYSFGSYAVKHVALSQHGCPSDTIVRTIVVKDKPVALINNLSLCKDVTGNFISQSTINKPDIVSRYYWDLGAGRISNVASPVQSFSPGTYTVKLLVESDKGCLSDTFAKSIIIEDFPVASFNFLDGCKGIPVSFNDDSKVSFGTINQWQWNFGDGATDAQQYPSHSYARNGTYSVTLRSVTNNGCDNSIAESIVIESIPVPDFENTLACYGKEINFTNKSTNAAGVIVQYNWDFGDGNRSGFQNPS
ncbi:MAG: PKD domain-containing protein, partial [Bacteroidota bacterium]|nr:PKD domain-containing protein [Bacteroidota bacterium]